MSKRTTKPKPMSSLGRLLARSTTGTETTEATSRIEPRQQFKRSQVIRSGYPVRVVGSLLSYEEIKKMAVCDLTNASGENKECLEDIRMGPRRFGESCATCLCRYGECYGHPGMMEIPTHAWFLHPFYVSDGMLPAILNLFCFTCFRNALLPGREGTPEAVLLFTKEQIEAYRKRYALYNGIDRLKVLAKIAKDNQCHESHPCSFFKKNTDLTISEHFKKKTDDGKGIEPSVATIFEFLQAITRYLDRNNLFPFIDFQPIKFEDMVIRAIYVIPTQNRPTESVGDGQERTSDITNLYGNMLSILREMKANETNEPTLAELRRQLRENFFVYVDSDAKVNIKNQSSRGGGPLKTLSNQFDGKGGLFHRKTWSSRVDNSGRTPIAGDNSLNPNEARIPKYLAEKFRIELVITASNKESAEELKNLGIIKTLHRGRDPPVEITPDNRDRIRLEVGDRTYRRMITGDAVIINRQPTLHRWSVLKMKAVVPEIEPPGRETYSVGLNSAYLRGFNADFDGDEVHLHIPMDIESRADAVKFMAVENTPISDQTSVNIFGIIQNTVWGLYEITRKPENLDKEEWFQLGSQARDSEGPIGTTGKDYVFAERAEYISKMAPKMYMKYGINDRSVWNTLSLISLAFPPDFSYGRPEDANGVRIENGIYIRGTMTGGISGTGAKSITQSLFNSHGPAHMLIYVHVMQQVVAAWMETKGFTISITDFMPTEALEDTLEKVKDKGMRTAKEIAQRNVTGIFHKDIYINELKNWLPYTGELAGLINKSDLSQVRNEMAYQLFDFMQVERNLYFRGRSDVIFRPERVEAALKKAVDTIVKDPEEITFKNPGDLIAAGLAQVKSRDQMATETAKVTQLKTLLLKATLERTIAFLQDAMANPLDSEKISTKSIYEKSTIEADTLDSAESIKNTLQKLVMDNPSEGEYLTGMAKSGARGKANNIVESKAGLGQQTMSGARLKEGISGGTRVLPFFLENDPSLAARGFIRSSFVRGQDPAEYYSAAAPARQTQTDTAFKTGETGYMQKKLMAFCGDFAVCADGSVRDEKGNVVTFAYGGDLFDPSRMVKVGDGFSFVDVDQLVQEINAEFDSTIKSRKKYIRGF